ncbi:MULTISPECIES: response regulator [Streptomyces]|uniref:DNA-binding response regulator, NarL/FixJ family, contains REC and HTH domains n=2 Tax=Streptomyces TaxID=1883 RepID=A0A1I6SUS2_9ACTN|nr:response regulator transcription factor [Streptomyces harbinensis]QKV69880.1 response regulator transcription factor [Streptomyces harbinensis]SFS80715.1 DNA-binding response regulator, NarL/FixJ family, contains REC and HTH domains [Streptomyces harbinensis]
MNTIRVLVADDQPLIRAGLVALLNATDGMCAAGEAGTGDRAVHLAAEQRPDVILMDIRMPGMDGIAATREILRAAGAAPPRIIILTTFDLPVYIYTALGEGAAGFLLKDTPPDRIVSAVRAVAAGDMLIAPRITRDLVETYAHHHRTAPPRHDRPGLDVLTPRETDVLELVGRGLTNAEIATHLVLSEATVKTHVKRLMNKLALTSRAQAVVTAYESGLITPGGPPRP